jgi:hypothetical protein
MQSSKAELDGQSLDLNGPPQRNPMRTVAYIFLILFLVVATVSIAVGAYFGVSTLRGAQAITNPVGELVRQLVVEATPVILPNPVIVVEEINSLARLETTSYSFQDVVQIERNQERFLGVFGESLLFVAYGDVIAGVDLAKLESDDLQVLGPTSVMVHLPEAEIFLSDLDNDRSYVADRDIGLLTKGDAQLETVVRQEAEARMVEAAMANDIIDQANQEAEKFVSTFLEELGFEEVIFTDDTPPLVTPYVQELPKGYVGTATAPALVTPSASVP